MRLNHSFLYRKVRPPNLLEPPETDLLDLQCCVAMTSVYRGHNTWNALDFSAMPSIYLGHSNQQSTLVGRGISVFFPSSLHSRCVFELLQCFGLWLCNIIQNNCIWSDASWIIPKKVPLHIKKQPRIRIVNRLLHQL